MRIIISILLITVVVAGIMFMIARTFVYKPKISTFGQPISESMVTAIPNILAHPEQFQGKIVRIEGVITEECPAGGWFILKDQSGIIYVNLHPSEFAIPQVVGRHVVTQGLVRKEGTQVEIIGKGVQIK